MGIDMVIGDGPVFSKLIDKEKLQRMLDQVRMEQIENDLIRECGHCRFYRTMGCPFSVLDVKRLVRTNPKPTNAACEKFKTVRDSEQQEMEQEYMLLKLKQDL